jgi:hypothetical protein
VRNRIRQVRPSDPSDAWLYEVAAMSVVLRAAAGGEGGVAPGLTSSPVQKHLYAVGVEQLVGRREVLACARLRTEPRPSRGRASAAS